MIQDRYLHKGWSTIDSTLEATQSIHKGRISLLIKGALQARSTQGQLVRATSRSRGW